MKYLVVLLVIVAVLWFTLRRSDRRPPSRSPKRPPAPQAMVQCAHCGVHLPSAEAVTAGGLPYCSEAHRLAGPRRT